VQGMDADNIGLRRLLPRLAKTGLILSKALSLPPV
jgi:hypothetical protein